MVIVLKKKMKTTNPKHRHHNKNVKKSKIKYKDCYDYLEYTNAKHDLLISK